MYCDVIKYIQRQLYFMGAYEEESCSYWLDRVKQAAVAFDVGANVGLYSLLAASANPQCRVYAFEPTPALYKRFRANLDLNSFRNVILEEAAVGARSESGFLHWCTGQDNSNEDMNYVKSHAEAATYTVVVTVSVDDYCSQKEIDRINVLKLDIEGGEYDALLGATALLRRKAVDCILMETVDWSAARSHHSVPEVRRLLRELGYAIFALDQGTTYPVTENDLTVHDIVALPLP